MCTHKRAESLHPKESVVDAQLASNYDGKPFTRRSKCSACGHASLIVGHIGTGAPTCVVCRRGHVYADPPLQAVFASVETILAIAEGRHALRYEVIACSV